MNTIIRTTPSILLIIFLFSCANQTQPTGGPKDEDPPVLVSSIPQQNMINVSTNKVELTFDEYIKTQNPNDQLIITPRIDVDYEVKIKKNKAIITFEKELPDSTTFTFNFREALVDITEGNAPVNLKLSFSTGSYLDSLSISGTITDHLTGKVVENTTVALYPLSDTLDLFTDPPLYFTKSNEEGLYLFENLKPSEYRLYSFLDANKNLMAESKTEAHGFLSDTIRLDSSITHIDVSLISLDVRPLELQSSRQTGTTFNIKYNKSLASYSIVPNSSDRVISTFSDALQTDIKVFNTFPIEDSLYLYLTATDSLNNIRLDTVTLQFQATQRRPIDLTQQLQLNDIVDQSRQVNGTITFNKPITQISYDSTFIYIDSLHIYPLDTSSIRWNADYTQAEIHYVLDKSLFKEKKDTDNARNPENSTDTTATTNRQDTSTQKTPKPELKPHIRLAQASFISAESDSSQNIKTDLTFKRFDQFGTVIIDLDTQHPNYLVQLLDSRYDVVQQKSNESSFKFEYIPPGTYRIRIVIDQNANQRWDPGNIFRGQLPERVLYYQTSRGEEEIIIRANFEISPDSISF